MTEDPASISNEFKVSVITPVYNAAEFVTRAVESALAQPETGEVLLIEDGSPDDSLAVCRQLAAKYEKVRLLQHPGGGNRGAGASRNLGMKNAHHEYIAFVDADNFYLPERFQVTKETFKQNPDCEGVYEAIGIYVENDKALERWVKSKRQSVDTLVTLNTIIDPSQLGPTLIVGKCGSLTLDGLVLKKYVIEKSGLMNPELHLHQDTDFLIKSALIARLYPGSLDAPVAMEGVHEHNRFSAPRSQAQIYSDRMAYWLSLYHWAQKNASREVQRMILDSIISFTKAHKYFKNFPRQYFPTRLIWFTRLFRLLRYPQVLKHVLVK